MAGGLLDGSSWIQVLLDKIRDSNPGTIPLNTFTLLSHLEVSVVGEEHKKLHLAYLIRRCERIGQYSSQHVSSRPSLSA